MIFRIVFIKISKGHVLQKKKKEKKEKKKEKVKSMNSFCHAVFCASIFIKEDHKHEA